MKSNDFGQLSSKKATSGNMFATLQVRLEHPDSACGWVGNWQSTNGVLGFKENGGEEEIKKWK